MLQLHSSQLSVIVWEAYEEFLYVRQSLITGPITNSYIYARAEELERSVNEKARAMKKCVGFVNETVIYIARPDDPALQKLTYNGQKR